MGRVFSCRLCMLGIMFFGCLVIGRAQEVFRQDSLSMFVPESGYVGDRKQAGQNVSVPVGEIPVMSMEHTIPADTLSLSPSFDFPSLRTDGTIGYFPDWCYGPGIGLWNLHEGFNANLSLGICAPFGKNRFPGVGFGTSLSAMYASCLPDKLVMAVGGFYNRFSWNSFNENRLGVNLILGYQITDKVGVYAYGSKAFTPSSRGGRFVPPMLWMERYNARFGGMIHVKVSDAVSFSVSVEERSR